MAFGWAYFDEAGRDIGSSEDFADRDGAEAWMGQNWEGLLGEGVEEVELIDRERDRRIYRMGLRAET